MYDNYNSRKIIDRYSKMIYRIALGYLENEYNAQDIVQEVLIKYIKYLKGNNTFNNEEHEKNWLIRVTENICCNELSAMKNKNHVPYDDEKYIPFVNKRKADLYDAIRLLKNKYKTVIILFYINGMTILEISKALKISESNVKTRLKRAREYIKQYFEEGENTNGRF